MVLAFKLELGFGYGKGLQTVKLESKNIRNAFMAINVFIALLNLLNLKQCKRVCYPLHRVKLRVGYSVVKTDDHTDIEISLINRT